MKFLVFFSYILLLFSSKCKQQDEKPLNELQPCSSNCINIFGMVRDTPSLSGIENVSVKLYLKDYLWGGAEYIAVTNTDKYGNYSINFSNKGLDLTHSTYSILLEKDGYFVEPNDNYGNLYYGKDSFLPNRSVRWNNKMFKTAYGYF